MNRPCLVGLVILSVAMSASARASAAEGDDLFLGRLYATGGTGSRGMAVGDLDGDGRPDVVVANFTFGVNTISVAKGRTQGGYDEPIVYPSGGAQPAAVAIGDVTGDGRPDVVVANHGSHTVTVLEGTATGDLDVAISYGSNGNAPNALAIGDVTDDGRLDVVVTNEYSNTVSVLAGAADGALVTTGVYACGGASPSSVAIGDMGGNGRLDVVVASGETSGVVSVLLGNHLGGLDPAMVFASGGSWPVGLALGDFGGDGQLDAVVMHSPTPASASMCVLPGNSGSTLGAPYCYSMPGAYAGRLAVGDLSSDGRLDVVTAIYNDSVGWSGVAVWLGAPGGTFAAPVKYALAGVDPFPVVVADVDVDSRFDVIAAGLLTGTFTVVGGRGDGTLDVPPSSDAAGTGAKALAIADVSGDGRKDVVAANSWSGTIGVLLTDASGQLSPGVSYGSFGSDPCAIAVGDVNGDSRPDVVATNAVSGTIGVLAGDGGGAFSTAVTYDTGGDRPQAVAIGDVTGDGRNDVVVAHNYSGTVCVLAGSANGSLSAAVCHVYGSNGAKALALGDVTGDGRLDAVVAVGGSGATVRVLPGNATGSFDAALFYGTGASNPHSIALADLTGDGRPDVVVGMDGAIGFLAGTAGGTLSPPVLYFVPSTLNWVATGDVDADGRQDVVVLLETTQELRVFAGNAGGGLDAPTLYSGGGRAVAVGDVSGDGRPDVVVGPGFPNNVAQLTNRLAPLGTASCFGDGSTVPCPCGNTGATGHGCQNSVSTGGAKLVASGSPSLALDSVGLHTARSLRTALTIFLQGNATIAPTNFGDGLRCAGGALKRLYVKNAVWSAANAPGLGDLSVSARSAAAGDPLSAGAVRIYQAYYRDANQSFCPAPTGSTFNSSNALTVTWGQ